MLRTIQPSSLCTGEREKKKRTRAGLGYMIIHRLLYVNEQRYLSHAEIRGYIDDRGICKGVAYSRATTDLYADGFVVSKKEIREGREVEVFKITDKGMAFGKFMYDVPVISDD